MFVKEITRFKTRILPAIRFPGLGYDTVRSLLLWGPGSLVDCVDGITDVLQTMFNEVQTTRILSPNGWETLKGLSVREGCLHLVLYDLPVGLTTPLLTLPQREDVFVIYLSPHYQDGIEHHIFVDIPDYEDRRELLLTLLPEQSEENIETLAQYLGPTTDSITVNEWRDDYIGVMSHETAFSTDGIISMVAILSKLSANDMLVNAYDMLLPAHGDVSMPEYVHMVKSYVSLSSEDASDSDYDGEEGEEEEYEGDWEEGEDEEDWEEGEDEADGEDWEEGEEEEDEADEADGDEGEEEDEEDWEEGDEDEEDGEEGEEDDWDKSGEDWAAAEEDGVVAGDDSGDNNTDIEDDW